MKLIIIDPYIKSIYRLSINSDHLPAFIRSVSLGRQTYSFDPVWSNHHGWEAQVMKFDSLPQFNLYGLTFFGIAFHREMIENDMLLTNIQSEISWR